MGYKWYFECIVGLLSTFLLLTEIGLFLIWPYYDWQKYGTQAHSLKENALKFFKVLHFT